LRVFFIILTPEGVFWRFYKNSWI